MRRAPLAIIVAVLAAISLTAAASAQSGPGDIQAWSAVFVSGPPVKNARFLVWFDGHARFRDNASDLGVTIVRPGVGWRLGGGVDAWAGYARVVSRPENGPSVQEDRFWQQATYPITKAVAGALSGRTRLEQRFRNTGDIGWRLRQFVRWERRFQGRSLSPVVWNELFISLDDANWGQASGFDQNRLFAGVAWRRSQRMRLEAGYLNVRSRSPARIGRTDHNVGVNLFFGL